MPDPHESRSERFALIQESNSMTAKLPTVRTSAALWALALSLLLTGACQGVFDQPPPLQPEDDGVSDLFIGEGVGAECGEFDGEEAIICRDGLTCVPSAEDGNLNVCTPVANKVENDKCLLTAECMPPTARVCSSSSDPCATDSDCPANGGTCTEISCTDSDLENYYGSNDAATYNKRVACLGLHCGWAGFCVLSNTLSGSPPTEAVGVFGTLLNGNQGSPCATASECRHGLVCKFQGLGGTCKKTAPEAGDLGATCLKPQSEEDEEGEEDEVTEPEPDVLQCMAGLACSSQTMKCVPGSIFLNPDLFGGEPYCQTYYESLAPFGVRSLVPGEGQPTDFYSLPFPNDFRLVEGVPNIKSHPLPGPGLIGLDPLSEIANALPLETDGWSTQAGIFFRFTRPVDPDSLAGNVHLIRLPDGAEHPFEAVFTAERNKYICANYLMVQPKWGTPLDAKTTYAVVITDGVMSTEDGDDDGARAAVALDDTEALLDDATEFDPRLDYAWNAYEPLRDYLNGQSEIDKTSIVGATVFTTNDPTERMQMVHDAVAAADGISFASAPVICENGTEWLPCDEVVGIDSTDAGEDTGRTCPGNASDLPYMEIHAQLRIPMVQTGKRPYLLSGGALTLGGAAGESGLEYEKVCVSITIPRDDAANGVVRPPGGWPVMIYGHGTGGTYRTGAALLAEQLTYLQDEETGTPTPMVVIGYDAPMHASRKGKGIFAQLDSGPLFYNFTNPPAAKGNFYQGAADVFALAKFVATLGDGITKDHFQSGDFAKLQPEMKTAGADFKVDVDKIMYHGHSQGGATGPLITPFATELDQVVLSGTGGSLVYGLLGKKQPYDVSTGMSIALQEMSLNEQHPALHLMQYYFDEVDAAPYGIRMATTNPMHQLHVYGVDDTYTPAETSATYAASMGGAMVTPNPVPSSWFDDMPNYSSNTYDLKNGELTKNMDSTYTRATVVAHSDDEQAETSSGADYDGHFVVYKDKNATRWFSQWMATWITRDAPIVVLQ
jgi:hypothetical protein